MGLSDIEPHNAVDKVLKFELGDIPVYTDYRELVDKEKPELVAIATESGKHASIAIDCIEAGCNVIIEKPIALSLADADEVIRKGHEKGLKVCVSHQNRFNKSIRKVRDAVEKERFGRLLYGTAHVRWTRDWDYYWNMVSRWRCSYEPVYPQY